MKAFQVAATIFALFASIIASPSQEASAGFFGEEPKILQIFLLENARIYTEEEARIYEAAKLTKFREFATGAIHASEDAVYDVIFTSKPNTSAFRGNQDQLKAEGNHLIAASAPQPTCNTLAEAWATAARTIEIEQPTKIFITALGPAIDTGPNCDASTPISLPKAFPPQMALAGILADPRVVSFQAYGVHGDQEQPLLNHISLLGGWDRKRSGSLVVEIHSAERTITALSLRRFLR